MWNDAQLMLTVQLSILGMVVVFGMFFMWRLIGRMESKVNLLVERSNKSASYTANNSAAINDMMNDGQMREAMDHLFGDIAEEEYAEEEEEEEEEEEYYEEDADSVVDIANTVIVPAFTISNQPIQPLPQQQSQPIVTKQVIVDDDGHSSVDESSTRSPISRGRLLKMNLDAIRARCIALGIPDNGTKKELTERILLAHGTNQGA